METKEKIEVGFQWGTLMYIGEDLKSKSPKRKVLVRCYCGKEFSRYLGNLKRHNFSSCGSNKCRDIHLHKINEKVNPEQELYFKIPRDRDKEYLDLLKYWRNIEKNGLSKNIGVGMVLTHKFLKR